MDIVNEQTTYVVTITFKDEDGNPVTPSAATYRIDDAESATAIKAETGFSPSGSEYDLEITYDLNEILNTDHPTEERVLTIGFTYSGTKKGKAEYRFAVRNLSYVETPPP